MSAFKIAIVILRMALGGLFTYGGVQKFIPKPARLQTEASVELPPYVVKIKAYIGGLKQTDYFWPMLGIVEIVGGVLLMSQFLALLGAVILVPVTLNIFLFHAFLEPHDTGELLMTSLYLLANLTIIGWYYPSLKPLFLNFKTIY
jgi:uncharacterized membrane protein YphA (DoxX/SURF4 family)